MKNLATKLNLKYTPDCFKNLSFATSYANRSAKSKRIILGEGFFMVVCPSDAVKLTNAGYEYAL